MCFFPFFVGNFLKEVSHTHFFVETFEKVSTPSKLLWHFEAPSTHESRNTTHEHSALWCFSIGCCTLFRSFAGQKL